MNVIAKERNHRMPQEEMYFIHTVLECIVLNPQEAVL